MKNNKNGGLFAGIIMGLLMVIGGTVFLWWNEGNNVRNIKTTDEVEKNVVEITSKSDCTQYSGQLVAVGGKFTVEDKTISDDVFQVSIHSAALDRVVEIYQWEEETETDDDGGTTYSYNKVWHEGLIDSSNFQKGHDNPTSTEYSSDSFYAERVRLGNYFLASSQISQMETDKDFSLTDNNVAIPDGYQGNGKYVTNSANLDKPQIGDVRISWKYNGWKEVSLIAKVSGDSFVSYTSEAGKNVNFVTEGNRTAAEMIEIMRNQDRLMKWLFRLFGFLLVFFGYLSVISPLTKLLSYVPILGNAVNFVFVLTLFLLSLVHSLLVILIAWFRYRPLLSVCLLAGCAVIGVALFLLRKNGRAQVVQTA